MKKMTVVLFALLMIPAQVLAENTLRIGVIEPMAALMAAEEVKTRISRMESSMEREADRLRKMGEEIQRLDQRLQRDGMTMSTEDRNRLEDQRDARSLEAQSLQKILQRRVQSDQQELMEQMEPKLVGAIEEVAEEKGLDMVLNSQAAVYIKPGLDITQEVTRRLNSKQ